MSKKKVLVIGLDCLAPQLLFNRWLDILPNIKKLAYSGIWGKLESTIPCITVPAWSSMVTSKDPGELGFYGFRNRKDNSYDALFFANSLAVNKPTIWNILSRNRKTSVVIGIPQTYPVKPLRGLMVGCFLTPDDNADFTYPSDLKTEVNNITDGYIIDIKGFRTDKKEWLLNQIYNMTKKRFQLVNNWLKTKEWDFFMFVDMGPDRLHHGFWGICEPTHPKYENNSEFVDTIKNYYIYLDKEIGTLINTLDEDTTILIVSDHGARNLTGGICVNEWLIKNGLLTVKKYPVEPEKLSMDNIDWSKTYCWGEGGYYARIFFNVKGREPEGIIEKQEYKNFRDNLKHKFEVIEDESSTNINTKVFIPEDIYKETNGIPPDLIVYFGDLNYRSIGSIGYNSIYTYENDTGPDDANHDPFGVFVMTNISDYKSGKEINICPDNLSIYDVAPTILDLFGIDYEEYDMRGNKIIC
ncbi:MAG: alkaline phosphatase family protein [Cyanobacteriota bacterium]